MPLSKLLNVQISVCSLSDNLVVSEGRAAAHALLHTHVSGVTVPLATGLGHHLAGAEEPEEALLEVFRAAHAAAVELHDKQEESVCVTRRRRRRRNMKSSELRPHRGHDGVPRGAKDVGVVAAASVVVTLQLPAEVFSG